jgi:hypothetical protein
MEIHLMDLFRFFVALVVGGIMGRAFGLLQNSARRRYEKRQLEGKLGNGWALMPLSGIRVAYFLLALALVQFICPMLFLDGTQWWVSGGVVLGYGSMLYQQIRELRAAKRS